MTNLAKIVSASLLVVATIGVSAHAATPPTHQDCFNVTQWRGWKSPNDDTLYLGVNVKDVYRVDLSAGSPELRYPDSHLVSKIRGSNYICSALDLDLSVSDNTGFPVPIIAKSITKLTPEEVAAIPPKFRP